MLALSIESFIMVTYPRGTDYKTRFDSLLVNGGSLTTSTVSGSEVSRVSFGCGKMSCRSKRNPEYGSAHHYQRMTYLGGDSSSIARCNTNKMAN